jgi:sterol desaturase/sphingolipid hydroxylase (fatty acid hydroxylase superfamily)
VVGPLDASSRASSLFFWGAAALDRSVPSAARFFHLQHRVFAPAQGHNGFDKVRLPNGSYLSAEHYIHYLHHKYFEVNYGDGLVPFDRIFGTFHDGTDEATDAMNRRFPKRG